MPEQAFTRRRTLTVTLILTTICAILVTSASTLLKPRQQAWLAIEQNRAIVAAADLSPEPASLSPGEVVALFGNLDAELVDLESGRLSLVTDPITYRFSTESGDSSGRASGEGSLVLPADDPLNMQKIQSDSKLNVENWELEDIQKMI